MGVTLGYESEDILATLQSRLNLSERDARDVLAVASEHKTAV
jgi:hypothetical protein